MGEDFSLDFSRVEMVGVTREGGVGGGGRVFQRKGAGSANGEG